MTPVPPLAADAIEPFVPPLQLTFVGVAELNVTAVGSVMATVVVPEHRLASVAVIVYVPAHKLLAAPVALTDGVPGPLIV